MKSIDDLKKTIQNEQEKNKGHFEAGRQFHSESYVNLKKYFHNYESIGILTQALVGRINEINPKKTPTTFIGFRSYCGNLLSMVCEQLSYCNYYIIELDDDKLVWQTKPTKGKIEKNVIVVLPVSCTCSYVFGIKSFLENEGKLFTNKVSKNFINVFTIFHNEFSDNITYSSTVIKSQYQLFNWSGINAKKTITIHKDDQDHEGLRGFTIVDVYTALHLSHQCKLCFPTVTTQEELLHPYHQKYETTELLNGYPKYVYEDLDEKNNKKNNIFVAFTPENFKRLFFKKGNIHFYGNIKAKGGRYNHFINGNLFYRHNRKEILQKFFETVMSVKKGHTRIVFITDDEFTNNSSFLEDLSLRIKKKDTNTDITLLRFNAHHEFIDSFIENNKEFLIRDRQKRLLIYFEEVLSAAGTFKLLSDSIKHYCGYEKALDYNKHNKHGFDYIFTLIDRVALNTEKEVLTKLHSKKNPNPEKHFIKFFELNAPVFTSPHMGNAIVNEEKIVNDIKKASNLDAIKKYIIDNELIPKEINLPDDLYKAVKKEEDEKYEDLGLNKSRFNLIKLYCTDIIYKELSKLPQETHNFPLESIFKKIAKDNNKVNFTENETLLTDITLKILTKHPFIHYKNICEKVLDYCIKQLNEIITKLSEENSDKDELYKLYWGLRFYIKRLVELNSKFILSDTFFDFLFKFYNQNKIYDDLVDMTREPDFDNYKKMQIKTFSAFLIYCYKRLIYDDFGTSIRLEELLKKHSFHKKSAIENLDFDLTAEIIRDNYFRLLDMLALENIFPFKKFYSAYDSANDNRLYKTFDAHNYDFFREEGKGFEYLDWKNSKKKKDQLEENGDELTEMIKQLYITIKGVMPNNPKVSFIYKYREHAHDNKKYLKITMGGNPGDESGSLIELDDEGFLSIFIDGIEHNCKTQSFYTVLKKDEKFFTFNRHYDSKNKSKPTPETGANSHNPDEAYGNQLISEILKVDYDKTDLITDEENVYFFIRLSQTREKSIVGKGILIISLQLDDIPSEIFNVIDSKKMRNLLYIRNSFLKSIKPKFENESLQEVLERIKSAKIKSKFNHGIDILFRKATEELQIAPDQKSRSLLYPFNQIYKQLKFEALNISTNDLQKDYLSEDMVFEIFNIYKTIFFSKKKASKINLLIDFGDREFIETYTLIIDLVLPELFWTTFKIITSQKIEDNDLNFEVYLNENSLVLINPCYEFSAKNLNKEKGGLEMINTILNRISTKFSKIEPQKHGEKQVITKIQLNEDSNIYNRQ